MDLNIAAFGLGEKNFYSIEISQARDANTARHGASIKTSTIEANTRG